MKFYAVIYDRIPFSVQKEHFKCAWVDIYLILDFTLAVCGFYVHEWNSNAIKFIPKMRATISSTHVQTSRAHGIWFAALFTVVQKVFHIFYHVYNKQCSYTLNPSHTPRWHFCCLQSSIECNICSVGHLLHTRFRNKLMALTNHWRQMASAAFKARKIWNNCNQISTFNWNLWI